MVERRTLVRIAQFAGYAALGPVTGPLAAGAVRAARNGDRLLAILYIAAIPSALLILGQVLAFALASAGQQGAL